MKRNSIKYIGYFDVPESSLNRYSSPAAVTKMLYTAQALSKGLGENVTIVSPSCLLGKGVFSKGKNIRIAECVFLKLFPSFITKGIFFWVIKKYWHLMLLFIYLVTKVNRNEVIIVYHSLEYARMILWAKKIRKFKVILELNEIYTDVSYKSESYKILESEMINDADAYIFSTDLLNKKYNHAGKPCAIVYGTYMNEPQVSVKFNDGKIHIVYAGTFDLRKGGAAAAVAAAEFLPYNYHLHVIGFGNKIETEYMIDLISSINLKTQAVVSYDGLLLGKDYIEFLQQCDIGLSTQNPDASFNGTSFPSKILSYLSNGLSVVSINIEAVRNSELSECITFYEKGNAEDIAKAILSSKLEDHRNILIMLNANFIHRITLIFQSLSNS